jgi:hypothetical protein
MSGILINHLRMWLIVIGLSLVTESALCQSTEVLPLLTELEDGWSTLRPGGETRCAHGSEFEFYARPADSDRVLIYLYGGGACWDAEGCVEDSGIYAGTIGPERHPSRLHGILAVDDDANPVADHTIVAIPVCTGDVHLGDNDVEYILDEEGGEARSFTVHHRGMPNAMAAVNWLLSDGAPSEVVVAGSSAGSLAVPFYASVIARRLPDSRVVGIGDDAGSYRRGAMAASVWGLSDALHQHAGWDIADEEVDVVRLYAKGGRGLPNLRLYQIDHAHDATQRFFLERAGFDGPDVLSLLRENRQEIRERLPHFRSFTVGGLRHTILPQPAFYRYQEDGVALRDWVASIVEGREVSDVECASCHRSGLLYDEDDAALLDTMLNILDHSKAWNPIDRGGACPMLASTFSLRCTVVQAARHMRINPGMTAAAWEIFYEALELGPPPRGADPVVAFNNAPGRTYDDVIALITAVRTRIMAITGD